MLGLDFIRAERAKVEKAIEAKAVSVELDELLTLDGDVRRLKTEVGGLRAGRNAINARFKSVARERRAAYGRRGRTACELVRRSQNDIS